MSSPDVSPAQAGSATARARSVLDRARASLLDEQSGARDLRPVADACLDVTSGHPSGQAHLLASGRQNLTGLVRDPEARAGALARLRRFRDVVGALDDQGLAAGHLVAGVVVLPGGSELPVLLRPCRVVGAGDGDASILVEGPVALNPALVRELARRSAGAVDLPAVLGDRLRTRGNGFDPYPLLDLVQATLPAVPGAVLRRRLLLAPVSLDGDRVVSDLDRLRDVVPAHSPLGWLGEDWDAEPVELLPRAGQGLPDVSEPGTSVADLLDRFVPARLDPDQGRVMAAVLTGHSLAVDTPPGSGATTCAVAVASVAAATGRRCLVVVPTRAEGHVIIDRLASLGLGDMVADGGGAVAATPADAAAVASPGLPGAPGSAEDVARRHAEAGQRYRDAVAELRRLRRPWQVTRAEVLEVLAAAEVEGPRLTDVVLEQDPGTALSRQQLEGLVEDLSEAVRLGALDGTVTAWTGARITDRQGAQEGVTLARRLRDELVDDARTAAVELAQGTGTHPARTVAEIGDRFRLFAGLQATLDRLVPEVFDVPILDLVAATGDEEFRRTTGYSIAGPTRWRLQRRARRLVRPGVEVDNRQLHRLLSAAAAQRLDWQSISEGAGWAHLPTSTGAMVARLGGLVRACERLELLHPGLRLSEGTLDDVHATAGRLLEQEDVLGDLPRRTLLEQRVSERGGATLLSRLRALPAGSVTPVAAARELRLAWWLGVAEATAPATGARGATTAAAEQFAASQQDWVAGAAARVRSARAGLDPQLRLPDPVRVLVPADVADLPLDEHIDVVVVDDAGRCGFAEVCGAMARTSQVVVLGDLGVARTGSALGVVGAALPLDRLRNGHRTHEPALAGLAAVTGSTPVRTTGAPDPGLAVTRTLLEDAVGLPDGETDQLDSTEVEVEHVVRETLRLVVDLAAQEPPRSVAVISLTRGHAAAVATGVRRAVRTYPALAEAFSSSRAEPVVVASVDQTRGLERDEVLLTTGFARTPHGRVIHRFGPLDAPGGAGLVTTAVSRARHRLHVVTALRSEDLDRSRLRTPGAKALAAVLEAVEAAAGASAADRAVERPVAPPVDAGATGLTRSPVLEVLAQELRARGAHVFDGPSGAMAVTGGGGTAALVVDVDVEHPDPSVVAGRRAALVEAGWQHRLVAAELVAADVEGVAAGLAAECLAGDGPGEDEGKDEHGHEQEDRPAAAAPPEAPVATTDSEEPEAPERAGGAGAPGGPDAPDAPAVGDVAGAADGADGADGAGVTPPVSVVPAEDPVLPQTSPDDSDEGWGEAGPPDGPIWTEDDERILRERPPHW